ncbi:site-2 protease family protein [Candidatus Woesearchaeota archaeon]|nr:site-2 protease family protein [Candidatus Woesearchaeota archaeon]
MDIQTIFTLLFLLSLILFIYKKRKKVEIQKILFPILYFILYRTKLGIKKMDWTAKKFRKPLKYFGYAGVFFGFLGMILISWELLKNMYSLIFRPETLPQIGIVLPIEAKGVFYVPFFYWLISIFIIAIVHEFSHGILARTYNLRVKSSGFAFLGIVIPIIPAAFVEPDEKQIAKSSTMKQLSIFAAGPFSNIILGVLMLVLLITVIAPALDKIVEFDGVEVTGVEDGFPAKDVGLGEDEIIKSIDDIDVIYTTNFSGILSTKYPGESVKILTDKNEYVIELAENPENKTKAYLGIYVRQHQQIKQDIKQKFMFLPDVFIWLTGLVYWLFLLNLGIGLFNLVPLGPLDGGKMLQLVLGKAFKKSGHIIWKIISAFFLIILIIILLSSFFR